MNDETRETVEDSGEITDAAAAMVSTMQDEIDGLQDALGEANARVAYLEAATPTVAVVGDADLQALAATVRTAQRAGHPDAQKHLDTLLTALGAA